MKKQTLAIHTPYPLPDAYGALSMPVYHSAAYAFDTAAQMVEAFTGRSSMPEYSRVTNPTVTHLENKVRHITGAADVIALNTGMAAIFNTLLALASTGRNIVTSRHLFGNTYTLLAATLTRFGVKPRFCDLTDPSAVEAAIDDATCCLFLEIITNPQMEVADIRALADVAHRHGVPLVADTTIIPFTQFSAASLGVDVEVVSSTKYLSGGATCLGGLVIDYGTVKGFARRMRQELLFNVGAYMTPHAAYMQTLGLETLDARYRVQSGTALELARRLRKVPSIRRVNHVGLEDNPYHDLARRQFGPTAGAMLTIDLADRQACFAFLDRLRVVRRATNLFDNRSLAIHPASTIFASFSPRQLQALDVSEATVRISVGLEHADDLEQDIRQALLPLTVEQNR